MSDEVAEGAADLPSPFKIEPDTLDPAYVTEIVDHINRMAIAPDDACPVCGDRMNTVSSVGFKLAVKEAKGASDSGREMPLVATLCHHCGFTRFFNRNILDQLLAKHRQEPELNLEIAAVPADASEADREADGG